MNIEKIFQDKSAFFVVVSPKKSYLISVGKRSVKIVDFKTRKQLRKISISDVHRVAFSPCEQWVVMANTSGHIFVFSLPLFKLTNSFSSNAEDCDLAFMNDTMFFYSANSQNFRRYNKFMSYDCETEKKKELFEKDNFFYSGQSVTSSQNCLILLGERSYSTCEVEGLELIYSHYPYHEFSSEMVGEYSSLGIAYDCQKNRIAVHTPLRRGEVDILNADRKRIFRILVGGNVTDMYWVSQGNYLLMMCDLQCRLYDGNTFQEIQDVFSDLYFAGDIVISGDTYISIAYNNSLFGGQKGCNLYELNNGD